MSDEADLQRIADIAAERAYERARKEKPTKAADTIIQVPPVSGEEMTRIAKLAAKEAMSEVWLSMGIDPTKPLDFAKDLMFLRELRETMSAARRHGLLVLMALFVAGVVTACVSYLKVTHT